MLQDSCWETRFAMLDNSNALLLSLMIECPGLSFTMPRATEPLVESAQAV
jgi:hypothetical protein